METKATNSGLTGFAELVKPAITRLPTAESLALEQLKEDSRRAIARSRKALARPVYSPFKKLGSGSGAPA